MTDLATPPTSQDTSLVSQGTSLVDHYIEKEYEATTVAYRGSLVMFGICDFFAMIGWLDGWSNEPQQFLNGMMLFTAALLVVYLLGPVKRGVALVLAQVVAFPSNANVTEAQKARHEQRMAGYRDWACKAGIILFIVCLFILAGSPNTVSFLSVSVWTAAVLIGYIGAVLFYASWDADNFQSFIAGSTSPSP